jgi:hypothetical protein
MPNGFRRVPVESEVAPGYRQIRRYGHFFALVRSQQGAVVADAQPKAALLAESCRTLSSAANLGEQGEFALSTSGFGLDLLHPHLYENRLIERYFDQPASRQSPLVPIMHQDKQCCCAKAVDRTG